MRTLITGLVLAVALAQATPVIFPDHVQIPICFGPIFHPVTAEDTPEWAKLPGALAWYEMRRGIQIGGTQSILLLLRAVLVMDPEWRVVRWLDIYRVGPDGRPLDQPDSTPEPGTLVLMTAGAALLVIARCGRYARSNPCWRR